MGENPFAEPDDDRTVFRPMPGGQRGAARLQPAPVAQANVREPPAAPPAPPPRIPPGADLGTLSIAFTEPLLAAAAPLLQLLARLRNSVTPPDQGDVRDRTARELREFERRAREAGVAPEQVRPAHYALCASLDDVALNTPWGAHGRWKQRTLAATFHQEEGGGDGFFDQLRLLRDDPHKHRAVLELMYICMALGFMGRFRQAPDGAERMDRIRQQTYALISGELGPNPPGLSQRWEGVDAPYRPRRTRFPVWVAFCVAVAAVAGGFLMVLNGLNAGSDAILEAAQAAPPAQMPALARPPLVRPPPPPPEPPPPGSADRLRAALAADAGKTVAIIATPSATILRIPAAHLFPQPNATLGPNAAPLLERIGAALKAERGPVRVLGYTDNQRLRTVNFPSNFALSNARAQAVRAALAKSIGEASRLSAEGRADADPIAPNNTAEGRQQNQRIDITVQR